MNLSKQLIKISDILNKIQKDKRIKYFYKIGQQNIFVFIIQNTFGFSEDKIKDEFIKIQNNLKNLQNITQTKLTLKIIKSKILQNQIYTVGAYSILNYSDDQCRKIIYQLKNLNFKQFGQKKITTRDPYTLTTQCSFY